MGHSQLCRVARQMLEMREEYKKVKVKKRDEFSAWRLRSWPPSHYGSSRARRQTLVVVCGGACQRRHEGRN
jgi:hypothetical protein